MSKRLAPHPGPLLTPVFSPPPQLADGVVQFLEKDATWTEHVSTSGGRGKCPSLQV